MPNEESEPPPEQQVKLDNHSSPDKEKTDHSTSANDPTTTSLSKEKRLEEREENEGQNTFNSKAEVASTLSTEEAPVDEVNQEISSGPVEKEGVYKDTKENRSNGESEAGENQEDKLENKEKMEDRKYATNPSSPSQVGHCGGYGGQGYMPMYGHSMYSQYGYPHYPQPPYYPGGYHHHYSMLPPHMVPPQQYPHESEQIAGSPGRRYPMPPPYYPYPPASPVLSPKSGSQPHYPAYGPGNESSPMNDGEQKEGAEGDIVSDDINAVASRIKIYVKQSGQASEEVMARRSRKNAQSRARAAKHREYVAMIEAKDPSERTPEECQVLETHQMRRKRKNDRSRERALEKKEEADKILAKPEANRTKIENQFLEAAMSAKKRKNEGDRLRRRRLKDLGLASKGLGKPGISARGPLPSKYAADMAHTKQMELNHHVGVYGMPPHGYVPMIPPPPPHEHAVEDPHSPGGAGVYWREGVKDYSKEGD